MTTLTPAEQVQAELNKRELYLDYIDQNPHALTLQFLAEHNLPVFVRNIMRIPAVNILEVKTADGRKITLTVQDTTIPQELTNQAPASAIATAFHVIKALNDETIELVNPRQALEELKSPSAQRRLKKLGVSNLSKNSDAVLPDNFVPQRENLVHDGNQQKSYQNELANPPKRGAQVNDRMLVLIANYEDKKIDQDTLIDSILDASRSFVQSDWLHLKASVRDPEIQGLCDQQLSARN
jgi:hypothetical protein